MREPLDPSHPQAVAGHRADPADPSRRVVEAALQAALAHLEAAAAAALEGPSRPAVGAALLAVLYLREVGAARRVALREVGAARLAEHPEVGEALSQELVAVVLRN